MSAEVLKTELVQVGQDSLQVVRQSGHGWVLIKAACEALGVYTVEQRTLLGHTEHCTVSPRAKRSDKVVSLIEWSRP